MEGITISLTELVSYAVGLTTLFLVPYLIWLHNRVMDNQQTIAVNTANDSNRAELYKSLEQKVDQILSKVSAIESELSFLKGKGK